MAQTSPSTGGDNKLFVFVVAGIVVVGMAAIAFVASQLDSGTEAADDGTDTGVVEQTAAVSFEGEALEPLPDGLNVSSTNTDPEAGLVAPSLTATTFDGSEVTIGADGSPKVIYFLAHWCPHCQAEVPLVQQLIDDGSLPEGLEIYGVSTIVDSGRGNHPPSDWFPAEGFTPTVVRDDADSSAFRHFGGSGLPYAVYLDGENRVVARSAGSLQADVVEQLWQTVATAG